MSVSEDKLVAALKATMKAIDAAEVPADLRAVAFKVALGYRLGKSEGPQSNQPFGTSTQTGGSGPSDGNLAQKLKLSDEELERVFDIDMANKTVEIVLPTRGLGKSVADAMRKIALLLSAARQASGIDEEETESEVIRAECARLGKYDANNFAARLDGLKDLKAVVRGKGQKKRVKITVSAYEEAHDMIKELLGGEGAK